MITMGSVITAMITPFDANGRVDLDGAAELARWLVEQGNDALLVTGTTGEANTLNDDEQAKVWRTVRAAVEVPLMAGCGTNDTDHSTHLVRLAERSGMDCALIVTPYYNRPSQAGIDAHFRAVEKTICHGGAIMSDLQRYFEKRKKNDPDFSANYEYEYEQFKIGVLLRELRLKEGMTQEELAQKLKTKKSVISRMENHAEDVRLSTLEKVAGAFGKKVHITIE